MRLPFRHPGDVSWLPAILHGRRSLTDEAHARNVAETLRESQPSGQGLGGGPIRAKCRTCRPGYWGHAIVHSMTERKSNVDAPHRPPAVAVSTPYAWFEHRSWFLALVLVVVTFLAYQPA
jgi:hypothetical protein